MLQEQCWYLKYVSKEKCGTLSRQPQIDTGGGEGGRNWFISTLKKVEAQLAGGDLSGDVAVQDGLHIAVIP